MALRAFKHLRAGLESVRGTNVAPTRGVATTDSMHNQEVETLYPEELRNSYAGHYMGDAGTETNSFEIGNYLGYNFAVWIGNVWMKAIASGTGAGADKTYTFIPTYTSDDLKTATLQWGYTDAIGATRPAWEVGFCLGDELTLTWDKSPGQPGTAYRGRLLSSEAALQVSAYTGSGTFTTEAGGLVKANNTAITIDTTTLGSTADNNVISVEWTLNNGAQNMYSLNNTTAAQLVARPNPFIWTATLRRYFADDTENDVYVSKTIRKVRVRSTGPALGGSTYKIDHEIYGKYTGRSWTEVDGFGIEEYTLSDIFDTGAATSYQMVVVSDLASIT